MPKGLRRLTRSHDRRSRHQADTPHIHRLVDGGLPLVLSQTFRSLIHSRLELGMKGYRDRLPPDTDIVLIEPDPRDGELFLANTFSYRQRRHLAEHAYQATARPAAQPRRLPVSPPARLRRPAPAPRRAGQPRGPPAARAAGRRLDTALRELRGA